MKFASPWLRLWKLSRIRIEIKTSIGRFREKGGYIMKEEMQKKLFCKSGNLFSQKLHSNGFSPV